MFVDLVVNTANGLQGQGAGAVLQGCRWEPGLLRPFYDNAGRRRCTVNTGRTQYDTKLGKEVPVFKSVLVEDLQRRGINSPVFNAATLTKQAWQFLDDRIVKATRQRLRAFTDLASANSRSGFDAMSKMTFEYQSQNDPGEAVEDMDALTDGRADRPLVVLSSLPLPITHSDFYFSEREIAVSKGSGMQLDSTMAEASGRRVSERVEKVTIGTETGATYGTVSAGPGTHRSASTVQGYTNFTYRVTKTDLTTPTGSNPEAVLADVLEMIETMQGNGFFGPYILYHSTGYSRFLSDDYFRTGSTSAVRSLRQRLMEVEGLTDIRRLDYLTSGYQLILIQMTSDVAEAINGMGITTLQWPSQGGLRQNFKVMCIQVPLLKAPYNGISGILHGTTS